MKKSEAYKVAQFALLNYAGVGGVEKLEILRVLMAAEDLAKFTEKQEEKGEEE